MLRTRIRTPTDPEVIRDFSNVRRVTFGRASDSDLVLEGTYVSRLHGELLRLDGGWCAINHGSRTPLVLLRGDARTELAQGAREALQHGDVLQILHTRIEIDLEGSATATDFGLPFVRDAEKPAESSTHIRVPLAEPAQLEAASAKAPCPAAPVSPVDVEADAAPSEIETAFETFAEVCSAALEARSGMAPGHARRVASYAVALARALRRSAPAGGPTLFSASQLLELRWAALLHDFGTLALPDSVLTDGAAIDAYAAHVERGCELLQRVAWPTGLRGVPLLMRLCHERLDGSGYPAGLAADQIPTAARILAIADLFDAVSVGERPGRPTLAPERALEVLRREARAGRVDAELVELLAHERPWAARAEEDTGS